MKTQKIMLGQNLKSSEKFGNSIVSGAICLDVLEDEHVQSFAYTYEGKRYLNIKVVERKSPSQFGKTHYLEIDQFVPNSENGAS